MKYNLTATYSRKNKTWRVASGLVYFDGFKSKDDAQKFIDKANEQKKKDKK